MGESTQSTRARTHQFRLKEILIAITALCVVFAIARVIGSLGVLEIGFFILIVSSAVLANREPSRLYIWVLPGLLLGLILLAIPGVPYKPLVCSVLVAIYLSAGAPVAIAAARGLLMRRWLICEFGVALVATALTPADLGTSLLVYGPLQFAMFVYAFFAKDGEANTADDGGDAEETNGETNADFA